MNSKQLEQLAPLGTSCPDHFLRTKIRPLIVPHDADGAALDAADRGLPRRLRGLLRALQACQLARHARSQCGDLSRAAGRHAVLRQGQGDGAHRRRVLRQCHQRHARRLRRLRLRGPAGAGGLQHRILAARGSQAAAHAEAQEPRGPRRLHHRRRRRHRLGHRLKAAVGRRLRGAGRYRPGLARRGDGGLRQDLWQGQCPRRDHGRDHARTPSSRAMDETALAYRRPRHRGQQCRHHPGGAGRGHHASNCGTRTWRSSAPAISWWRARAIA